MKDISRAEYMREAIKTGIILFIGFSALACLIVLGFHVGAF